MPAHGARLGSKALLSLCHEVDQLAERLRASTPRGPRHLESRRRQAVRRLRAAIHRPSRDAFRVTLRALMGEHALTETDVVILLVLFNRRIRKSNPSVSGRELLDTICRGSSEVLEAAPFLHPGQRLLRAGLVAGNALVAEDVFDAQFRIGEGIYRALYRAFHGLADDGCRDHELAVPYANGLEHLLDYRLLCETAKRRASRLFSQSYWAEATSDEERSPDDLDSTFQRLAEIIAAREHATPESVTLPIVQIRAEYGLSAEEELIVVTLLLQELFASRAMIELGELIRLVADSEAAVLLRRPLISAEGRLRQQGLICVEEEPDGKDMFASAWLPASLSDRLLGGLDPRGSIGSEERTRFHDYLERLRGSEDFYRRL
jgi:hypothetical protein